MAWLRLQLWILTGGLCAFGLMMIASTTAASSAGGEVNHALVIKQALAMALGAAMAIVVSASGLTRLASGRAALLVLLLAVGTLLAVLAFGRTINGARRWLDLGPFNLQPAEIAKVAVVLAAAWWFAYAAERVRAAWEGVLLPLLGFAVLGGLVFMTKDLGSVVVMGATLAGLLLFAGANVAYFAALVGCLLPLLSFVAVFRESYRYDRIMAFLDPNGVEGPAGYHLRQSLIAFGSGGLFGAGLGQSTARLGFVPEAHTDSIFTVIGADLGLAGAALLALAFLWLTAVGLLIAWRCASLQGRLIAVGCTMIIVIQAFWHMLMNVGGVPTKGLTLPFISYGGSSVAVCLVLVGMLDAVARASAAQTATARLRGAVVRSRERWNEVRGRAA